MPVRSRYKTNVEEGLPPIKVVFPTERHVVASRLGEAGAGTICSQRHYWDEHSFPKRIMHDYECVGDLKGSMMHSKVRNGLARVLVKDLVSYGSVAYTTHLSVVPPNKSSFSPNHRYPYQVSLVGHVLCQGHQGTQTGKERLDAQAGSMLGMAKKSCLRTRRRWSFEVLFS